MKQANGLGSIYKESGKRSKKWRVVVTLGYEEDGKQIRKTLGYFKTKSEAQEVLSDFHGNKMKYLDTMTIKSLYDLLLKRKSKTVSASTMQGYKSAWNRFKVFKDVQIKELTTEQMQDVIDKYVERKEVGFAGAKQYKILARLIFDLAIELRQIQVNYANYIILPKRPKVDNSVFSDEDIETLRKDDSLWSKIILVNIFLLARPSEILNITVDNVNLDENYVILGSKTKAGIDRYVPIHEKIKDIIAEFYHSSCDGYLLNYLDKKVEYGTYLKYYTETINKLGIKYLSPHKCRKTGGTIFSRSGISEFHLKRIMGHESFEITDKYYIGDINKEIQNAVNNLVIE